MSNKWSRSSAAKLAELTPELQRALNTALELFDMTIVTGFRDQAAQDAAVASGHSKVRWPNGKHNKRPSVAVDIQPYPMPRSEAMQRETLSYLCGLVSGVYYTQTGRKLRWGGNWDQDSDLTDNRFDDLFHLEESA